MKTTRRLASEYDRRTSSAEYRRREVKAASDWLISELLREIPKR